MSPFDVYNSTAQVFAVNTYGDISSWGTHYSHGLRPVLNLRADTKFTGTGSSTNPFIVV